MFTCRNKILNLYTTGSNTWSKLKEMKLTLMCIRLIMLQISLALPVLLLSTCQTDQWYTDAGASLRFSTDTVCFDTIFTTIGSATLPLKVYNPYGQSVMISSISLAGGDASFFRLNIDGEDARSVTRIRVAGRDSLYIFINVTIDPLHVDNPMIIKDSIEFIINGTRQDVKLIAYGQDVHLVRDERLDSQTWTDDKPYLIYGYATVDTGQTLTVSAGARLYFHHLAGLHVIGTILVEGSSEKPVIMQHDRPETFYEIIPGQWSTILIDPISKGNQIRHAVIRNPITGILIGFPPGEDQPSLEITGSIIQNAAYAGIYASNAYLRGSNLVIADCGGPALALLGGGDYAFFHCTISNQGVIGTARSSASVEISNEVLYQASENEPVERFSNDLTNATFQNCIIYGSVVHELDLADNAENLFVFEFGYSLIKASSALIDTSDHNHFHALILNESPVFVNDSDRYRLDFRLDTLSPAKDAGDPSVPVQFPSLIYDLDGNPRDADEAPDLGAYERIEE